MTGLRSCFGWQVVALAGLALTRAATGADEPKPVTAEEVRALRANYEAERKAAEAAGLTAKFAPDWFTRADELAAAER